MNYNIKLHWEEGDYSLSVKAIYYLNNMELVEIYLSDIEDDEKDWRYKVNDNYIPINGFGGCYDINTFKTLEEAKEYVEINVDKWLNNNLI